MRTTLLAISLFAVSACAGGPSVPSTYSSLEVVTEVYDGPLEPRPPAGESLRRIGRQLEQLTAIAANRTRLLEMFEVADGAIRFYDEGVTRELAEISNLPDPEETRRSLPYNPTNIRNIRTILYGSAEPGEGGQRRELQTPHLDQVAPQELAELTGSLAGLAGNIRDGTLEAGDPGQDALAAIEVADAYINNFTTKLLLAWDRARELVAEVRKINPRALSGDPDSIRRLEELKLELASPETAREIASFVFFSNTVLLTSFGRTRVEILDPADPRIRASSGDAELREGVLGDEEAWQTVYGRTFAEGDGTNEFIIVQESPLHYRMKDFQTDPSDVVGLQVSFAESALSILSQVLGAGGAPYGLSALTLLEIDGDGGSTGVIDYAETLGSTDANGYWLSTEDTENGTLTLLLVEGFSGAVTTDLDLDDDGTLDATPWTSILDEVAVTDGGGGDQTYGMPALDASLEGNSGFSPGGASRIPDGTDTDAAGVLALLEVAVQPRDGELESRLGGLGGAGALGLALAASRFSFARHDELWLIALQC